MTNTTFFLNKSNLQTLKVYGFWKAPKTVKLRIFWVKLKKIKPMMRESFVRIPPTGGFNFLVLI